MTRPPTELFPADTTPEARRVQVEVFRQMAPERRSALAVRLSRQLREVAEAGVRMRHPDYTQEQVRLAAIRLRLGNDLFRKAYPGVEIEV